MTEQERLKKYINDIENATLFFENHFINKEVFYAAINNRLDINKIKVKSDGTTFLKLSLLKSINFLLSSEITLTDNAIYLNIAFDKALKTKNQVFALTLIDNNRSFIPQSLLNLKNINNFPNGKVIKSIKSVHLQSRTEIIYL